MSGLTEIATTLDHLSDRTRAGGNVTNRLTDDAWTHVLSSVAHDVRTPISAILGTFQLLQLADIPDRQKAQAKTGTRAVNQLMRYLENFLEFSRIEAGDVQLVLAPCPLRQVAEQAERDLHAAIEQSRSPMEGSVTVAGSAPAMIVADALRVNFILANLFENAVRHSGGDRVDVKFSRNSDTEAAIDVHDTGSGIPENALEGLFDKARRSASAGSGHIGFGLTVASDLAGLMDLTLTLVRSGPEGTTFRLLLPIAHDQCPQGS